MVLIVLFVALVLGTVAACNVLLSGMVHSVVQSLSVFGGMLSGALEAAEDYWSKP